MVKIKFDSFSNCRRMDVFEEIVQKRKNQMSIDGLENICLGLATNKKLLFFGNLTVVNCKEGTLVNPGVDYPCSCNYLPVR